MKKSRDVLILFLLVIARVRIDTLADGALPFRHEDVPRLVGGWWPAWSLQLLSHPETDPVSMLLIVTSFALLGLYFIIDILSRDRSAKWVHYSKIGLIFGIIGLLVFCKTLLLINLRQLRGPVSYAHDGGVIQTEVTIGYFLDGLNPYVEDYVDTPMAEWGYAEYRTALYHYPYLPWTFVFSAPIYLVSQGWLGWFDERLVYLLLFAMTLLLVPLLIRQPEARLIALAVIGLNPIGIISIIFGENDPFVLAWIMLALWLIHPPPEKRPRPGWRWLLGSAAYGLACASKPTAWFLAPFWLLYLLRDVWGDRFMPPPARWRQLGTTLWQRAWSLPVVALLVIGPWLVWNPEAMYDDVWRWSSGQGDSGYQIWGWGASNYVLALGWVPDRFAYWPFIVPGAIIALPLLVLLLWRQTHDNTMAMMLYGYVVLLFVFFYISRFMQPNYLGYMLSFLALAFTLDEERNENDVEREGSSTRFRTAG
ncbi:MAG: hypothetical protein KDJ52_14665 [Anaerolineae bacterium]|nr:hypothetical protein [Anaerolineae bacterium]